MDNGLLNTQLYFIAIQSSTAFYCIFDKYCNSYCLYLTVTENDSSISFHWLPLFYYVFVCLCVYLFVCLFVCKRHILFYWRISCFPILQLSILKEYFLYQYIRASLPAADPRNDSLLFWSLYHFHLYLCTGKTLQMNSQPPHHSAGHCCISTMPWPIAPLGVGSKVISCHWFIWRYTWSLLENFTQTIWPTDSHVSLYTLITLVP